MDSAPRGERIFLCMRQKWSRIEEIGAELKEWCAGAGTCMNRATSSAPKATHVILYLSTFFKPPNSSCESIIREPFCGFRND
jgi:hypothetical protein